jgi:hypothetical protein
MFGLAHGAICSISSAPPIIRNCPSSDDLRLIGHFAKRGSGSSGLEFKLPADVPIAVELRWADVVGMNVTQPRGVGNWFDCHAIVVSLKGRSQYRWAGAFLIAAFKLSNLIAFGRHRIAAVSPKLLKFLIRKSGTAIAKYLEPCGLFL